MKRGVLCAKINQNEWDTFEDFVKIEYMVKNYMHYF